MTRPSLIWLFSFFCVAASASAEAQMACDDPAYRQFDFWLGEWEVFRPDGTVAGTNKIKKEYNGCVLHERYSTKKGYSGESLNTYDPSRKLWHQTWVDNGGLLLLLEGKLIDGRMVLEGSSQRQSGAVIKHRIVWAPNPDGSVRQLWESTDFDGEWKTAFDGLYRRKDRNK